MFRFWKKIPHCLRAIAAALLIAALLAGGAVFLHTQATLVPPQTLADLAKTPQDLPQGSGLWLADDVLEKSQTAGIGKAETQGSPTPETPPDGNPGANAEPSDSPKNSPVPPPENVPPAVQNPPRLGNPGSLSAEQDGKVPGKADPLSGSGTVPGDIFVPAEEADKRIFFETTIRDGETVRSYEYHFELTHKIPELAVRRVWVYVGESDQSQWKGRLSLTEGKNSIRITVQYAEEDGRTFLIYKDYTIYLALPEAPPTEAPTASPAEPPNEALTVPPLGIAVSIAASTQQNPIVVHDPNIEFTAQLTNGSADARLTVVCGGITLSPTGNRFKAALTKENVPITVRLKATDKVDGQSIEKTEYYYFQYIPIAAEETAPRLQYINVQDGMTLKGTSFTLDLVPQDDTGKTLGYQNCMVQLNGAVHSYRWQSEYISYSLVFQGGVNLLEIRVMDDAGRCMDYSYIIHCTAVADGGVLGKVTVSVDAAVLGLGDLLPPVEAEIIQGETAAQLAALLLEQNGFTYEHIGSFQKDFYLARIGKPGIGKNVQIPADLLEALHRDGYAENGNYDADSISAFDHFRDSGWMYSLNGSFPGHGLSELVLQDGDVLKIRFTLALGKDIGASASAGGNANDSYGKIW